MMENNFLSVMNDAALDCFNVLNWTYKENQVAYTPHAELLGTLNQLFKTPTIRFIESYSVFIETLSSRNEALDSWCKLIALFTSKLGENYESRAVETFTKMFKEFGNISTPLSPHFEFSGKPTISVILAYMLCLVSSVYMGGGNGQ